MCAPAASTIAPDTVTNRPLCLLSYDHPRPPWRRTTAVSPFIPLPISGVSGTVQKRTISGSYRILYTIEGGDVVIRSVQHRAVVYKSRSGKRRR
jgi:hypothetical protein